MPGLFCPFPTLPALPSCVIILASSSHWPVISRAERSRYLPVCYFLSQLLSSPPALRGLSSHVTTTTQLARLCRRSKHEVDSPLATPAPPQARFFCPSDVVGLSHPLVITSFVSPHHCPREGDDYFYRAHVNLPDLLNKHPPYAITRVTLLGPPYVIWMHFDSFLLLSSSGFRLLVSLSRSCFLPSLARGPLSPSQPSRTQPIPFLPSPSLGTRGAVH